MSLRTIVYLRKSTQDKDEKQIHSIDRQRRDILEFIEKYNAVQEPRDRLIVNPEHDFIAEDASAKYPGRKKFNEMMKLIQKGRYDVLLCTELSRLSRNAVDNGALVQLLEEDHLIRIQTRDKVFTTTPTDKFTLSLFLTVSKYENDQRAVNTRSGLAHQKERGVTTHKAPMGYINIGHKKGDKSVQLDQTTCAAVRRIWDLFLTGNYSIPDLKREGDLLGITILNKDGSRSSPVETTYRGMLRNKYYAGFVKKVDSDAGTVRWIDGLHQSMITEEEFEKAQLILQGRGYKHQPAPAALAINSILSEILVCGKCQTIINGISKPTRMVFEQKTRFTCLLCKHRYSSNDKSPCPKCGTPLSEETKIDKNSYYRCGRRYSSDACAHDFYGSQKAAKNVRASDVEKHLEREFSKLYITDALFEVLRRQLYTLWLENNQTIKKNKDALRKALTKLEEERIKIQRKSLTMTNPTMIEREDLEHLLDANRGDQEAIGEEINQLREDGEEKFEKAWQSLNALHDTKFVFAEPNTSFEPKRKLILSLVSNLKITDNNWEIEWQKPFAVLAKAGISKRGRLTGDATRKTDKFNWLPILEHMRTDWAQEIIELGREIKLTGFVVPVQMDERYYARL